MIEKSITRCSEEELKNQAGRTMLEHGCIRRIIT